MLPNPGGAFYDLPDPLILDLQVTVSGSATGDGVFTLSDFTGVAFNTGGIALDFSRELVGQPTDTSPWGTPGGGAKSSAVKVSGRGLPDFNLFSNSQQPARSSDSLYSGTGAQGISLPPSAAGSFILQASSGENMAIVSFAPFAVTSVPSLNIYSIIGFALMLMLIGFIRLRKA